MTDIGQFRQHLADMLLSAAERRYRPGGDHGPSGEDLKVIALLERLAVDVSRLDPLVYQTYGSALSEEPLARRFLERRDELLGDIGIIVCPKSATALVAWLHAQLVDDTPIGTGHSEERRMGAPQISISVPISTTCEGGTSK